MKKVMQLIAVLLVLLSFTGIAAAAGPEVEPFSTTGYTTNLRLGGSWSGLPPLVPTEFEFLANGAVKFHMNAQGGAEDSADDQYCADLVPGLFPPPEPPATYPPITTCAELCSFLTGKPCGTDGFFPDGSFTFDEWGLIVDPYAYTGYNHGLMTIATDAGQAEVRFGGSATYLGVTGGFAVLDGTKEYNKLKGKGIYNGDTGYVFTVDYTPCGGKDQAACPDRCAVFGGDLKIKKDKLEWQIDNAGEKGLTLSKMDFVWPLADGPITKVKLEGKTIYEGSLAPVPDLNNPLANPLLGAASIDLSGWGGKDKELLIPQNKKDAKLEVEFKPGKGLDISANPWDYTILVEFGGGCAVPFVAFAPAPAVPVN